MIINGPVTSIRTLLNVTREALRIGRRKRRKQKGRARKYKIDQSLHATLSSPSLKSF